MLTNQKNDPEALKIAAQKILDENPEKVAEYKSGKEQLLMFFVGQIMKETKGSGNPAMIQEVLKELLQ
jgi:aspartyl-tRNA(Asn)/glutamyl-tRNA(Gln) amidotransferase subunit B